MVDRQPRDSPLIPILDGNEQTMCRDRFGLYVDAELSDGAPSGDGKLQATETNASLQFGGRHL
ncbi:hypothetical protein A3K89_23110 [Rhodococcoides kyotonense]|uniref:Uncharacterized protein n=1 Tax=Rhodococcoides kyotonense TaxID=398843 RepID=A0A177YDE9_9NOCA|nr:hypothetical protein A3K89_23110 [Rhodococcus kyotonensis]